MTEASTIRSLHDQVDHYLADAKAKRCPYELLGELRDCEPVYQSETGIWLITSYELSREVLRDKRFSREEGTVSQLDTLEPGEAQELWRSKLVNRDGPGHARMRQSSYRAFTPPSVDRWRPTIFNIVNSLIDDVEPLGRMEVVSQFAYPLPERLICEMLGVPYEDHRMFERLTTAMNQRHQAVGSNDEFDEASAALQEFAAYVRTIVQKHRESPSDDLVAQLLDVTGIDGGLSEIELTSHIMELINGGHHTTANLIVQTLLVLLEEPDRWSLLSESPDLIPSAVEEAMRTRSPVQVTVLRVTTEEAIVGNTTIPPGSKVLVSLAGTNRDPDQFVDPETFDLTRTDNRHLSFGFGVHFCIGSNLARAEIQIALEVLTRRLPNLRLSVDPVELAWSDSALVVAPAVLPVEWPLA